MLERSLSYLRRSIAMHTRINPDDGQAVETAHDHLAKLYAQLASTYTSLVPVAKAKGRKGRRGRPSGGGGGRDGGSAAGGDAGDENGDGDCAGPSTAGNTDDAGSAVHRDGLGTSGCATRGET